VVRKYELRGRRPGVKEDSIVVHATSPIKGILGWLAVGKRIEESPAKVWSRAGKPGHGVTRASM